MPEVTQLVNGRVSAGTLVHTGQAFLRLHKMAGGQ